MNNKLKVTLGFLLLILHAGAQEIFEQENDQFVRSLDDSYVRGLLFLQSTQNEDGTWSDSSYGSQPGVIGMAVLAFLSRGMILSLELFQSIEQGCTTGAQAAKRSYWIHWHIDV